MTDNPLQLTHDRRFLRRFLLKDRMCYLTADDVAMLRQASEAGDPYAQYAYGRWLFYFNPFDGALLKAEKLFVASKGHVADAQAALGVMIGFGDTATGTMDIDESRHLLEQAVARGSELGAFVLTQQRIYGRFRKAEPEMVLQEIKGRLATERDADPNWHTLQGWSLQELYRDEEAATCFERAMNEGEADACIYLACYYQERGNNALSNEIMEEGIRKGVVSCLVYKADTDDDVFNEMSEEDQQQLHEDIDCRLHRGMQLGDGFCAYYLWLNNYYGSLGYKKDPTQSFVYLQEGVRLGSISCILQMADMARNHELPPHLQPSESEICELWLRAARYNKGSKEALYGLKHSTDPGFLLRHKDELERYWRPLWEHYFPTSLPKQSQQPAKKQKTDIEPMVIVIWPTGHLDIEKADVFKMRSYREMGQALIGADGLDAVHNSPLLQAVAEKAELEQPLVMYVDRDAQAKDLPDNAIGTLLYGHGEVRGPIIICLQDKRHDCHSFTKLEDIVDTYTQIDIHCGGLLIVKDEDDGRWDAFA